MEGSERQFLSRRREIQNLKSVTVNFKFCAPRFWLSKACTRTQITGMELIVCSTLYKTENATKDTERRIAPPKYYRTRRVTLTLRGSFIGRVSESS